MRKKSCRLSSLLLADMEMAPTTTRNFDAFWLDVCWMEVSHIFVYSSLSFHCQKLMAVLTLHLAGFWSLHACLRRVVSRQHTKGRGEAGGAAGGRALGNLRNAEILDRCAAISVNSLLAIRKHIFFCSSFSFPLTSLSSSCYVRVHYFQCRAWFFSYPKRKRTTLPFPPHSNKSGNQGFPASVLGCRETMVVQIMSLS